MPPRRATDPSSARYRVGGYREFAPPPALTDCCAALGTHQTPGGPARDVAAHRVLPDVGISLAFQGFRTDAGEPVAWEPMIIGPKLHAQNFELVPGRELTSIRIKAEWVGPLLGLDPLDVENSVAPLAGICPSLADRLYDGLGRTRSAGAALQVLAAFVGDLQAAARTRPSPLASAALAIVRDSGGRVPCERAASMLGLSERHFRRQIHDSTGFAPKSYARALRLVGAMLTADAAERPAWADVALASGYCDQSHLIRDCVAMAGATPADLHRARRAQIIGA
jgi:AraC-like DNA-binding protein